MQLCVKNADIMKQYDLQNQVDGVAGAGIHSAKWGEHVVIADADYVDKVAFNLIVNFERMLGRRIPQADMARWLECVALDGGVRKGTDGQEISVVLIHDKGKSRLENFVPADYEDGLNGQAFRSSLGEFVLHAVAVEDITTKTSMLIDVMEHVAQQQEVKRLVVIPNAEDAETYERVRRSLHHADDEKVITVLVMQPLPGGNFRQEILGYSLMSALGIRGEELDGRS